MTSGDEPNRPRDTDVTETAPLLLASERPRRPSHRTRLSVTSLRSVHVPKIHNGRTIINLLCIIILISSSSSGFVDIPKTRLLEDAACRQYYGLDGTAAGPIDEKHCKVNAIQNKVALTLAIQSSADAAVGFLAAFPWGLAADRIGRKPIAALALTGTLLGTLWTMAVVYFHNTLPVELIWLSSAGNIIGGGSTVIAGIVLSMIADSTTEEERAVAFMRIHVASLCGELGAPALAGAIMARAGPWPPIWIAATATALGAVAFLFVPETLKHHPDQENALETESVGEGEEEEEEATGLKSRVSHVIARFKESLSMLKSTSLILLLLTGLVSPPVLLGTSQFMAQFLSKRYGIELYKTGYVQSTYGAVQVVQALVILPWLTRYVMKSTTPKKIRAPDEHHRDLSLARWSYALLAIGIFVLGLAPTLAGFVFGLVLMALGSGFNSMTRSLMSLYVNPEHRSRLFSLVAMVEVVGSVYAQPLLAALFALGMRLGGGWIGLPYYGLSVLIAFAAALLHFVKVPNEA
ncbi:MFS general substrate transporter [Daldinia caldariorum]|uniref:MFS general substrate transporter n=1 Tax=Daldinia caldariorum TaxID=326644 RepID=UPI002007B6CB|nr:MFS general substrate transporter [Daldinia caldariorum]KAI1465416.1 MFS general substrate transporter [Daldinia caldariorum]